MVLRIQTLSIDLANQIAAGEVIERPASVVKELLENSRDAGATHIQINVEYGGLNRIHIADNGHGIHPEDLPLAVAAHATSKIKKLDDLYTIHTMGFRGEALASISSISRLTILSKTEEAEQASQLTWYQDAWQLTPCARQRGTTVDVRELFYNAPVRKRFLKSEQNEFHALEGVVRRFALSTPQASIVLCHNNKVVLKLPAAENDKRLLQRLEKLFGKAFMQAAKRLDVERAGMRLNGWISDASYQRSQSDKQWVYVNQRMVKDKLINHALKQAYESVIYPGRHPACLLYLTIDPNEVDVNVHPTKHELRFQQPRLVHDFVYSQIKEMLGHDENELQSQAAFPLSQSTAKSRWQIAEPRMSLGEHSQDEPVTDKSVLSSLTPDYGLLYWQDRYLLFEKSALIEHALLWRITQQPLPLPARPLLVPLQHLLTKEQQDDIGLYIPLLQQAGIETKVTNDTLQWRSIPIALPQLSLQGLVDKIFESSPVDANSMITLLVKEHIAQLTSIEAATKDLLLSYCDNYQKDIMHNRVSGITLLKESHIQSIIYG